MLPRAPRVDEERGTAALGSGFGSGSAVGFVVGQAHLDTHDGGGQRAAFAAVGLKSTAQHSTVEQQLHAHSNHAGSCTTR